ncbi:hypothetical protein N8I77_013243 [Diaporthe amygdali]|uniref:DUF7918 domain-containing protein n=1 Tax=Phomopsis amygdali TaxID=1214568 RepID=A0AAD9VWU5_PHOAM|nr:hypothetical protein N8I77_013243 [Diaporthe amygdali]
MCILEDVGLEVEVLVNHRATKEYPYRQPNSDGGLDTTAVCRRYIQSEEGALFSFRCSVRAGESAAREWLKTPSNAILFEVNIDDREGLKSVARYVELAAPSTTIRALPDIANEQQRWFRFASIPTDENCSKEEWTRDLDLARRMGVFRIRAWRVVKDGVVKGKPKRQPYRASDLEIPKPLAEKALTKLREDEGRMISHEAR